MTYKQILNTDMKDIMSLERGDLANVVSILSRVANKRVQRLEKNKLYTPALRSLEQTGSTRFSTKGKSLNQLRGEFIKARQFLSNESSTVTGFKSIRSRVRSSLEKEGVSITDEQYDTFWEAYEKLKSIDHSITSANMKYNILKTISEEMDKNIDIEKVIENLSSRLDTIYEEVAENDWSDGFSEYFRFSDYI